MSNSIGGGISGIHGAAGTWPARQTPKPAAENAGGSEFLDTLKGVFKQVEQLQTDAGNRVGQMLSGNGEDVHSAMAAVEKADLAFEMMMQVRTKIVQAYQEISRMPF